MSASHSDAVPPVPELLSITLVTANNKPDSILHIHHGAQLICILQGSGQISAEGSCLSVSSGDLVFVKPLAPVFQHWSEDMPLECIILGIDTLPLPLEDSALYRLRRSSYSEDARSCIWALHRELSAGSSPSVDHCRHLFQYLNICLTQTGHDAAPSSSISKEIRLVHNYINTHFRESVTLDDLAHTARLSKYHLSHIFKREFGISPINYLLSLRVRESQRLLIHTTLPLSQVAAMSGFSSLSYFSQSFRKAVGITPVQYRRENGQSQQDIPEDTQ